MRRLHHAAISAHCCAAPATSPVWPPAGEQGHRRRADRARDPGGECGADADRDEAEVKRNDERRAARCGEGRRLKAAQPPRRVDEGERSERARAGHGRDEDQPRRGAKKNPCASALASAAARRINTSASATAP